MTHDNTPQTANEPSQTNANPTRKILKPKGKEKLTGGDSQSTNSTSEGINASTKKTQKKQNRFDDADDLELLKAVYNIKPYKAPHGSMSTKWEEIASHLRKRDNISTVDGTACQRRFANLLEKHQQQEQQSKKDSGVEEDFDEATQLLTEISLEMEEHENEKALKTDKEKKYLTQRESATSSVMAAAMQTLRNEKANKSNKKRKTESPDVEVVDEDEFKSEGGDSMDATSVGPTSSAPSTVGKKARRGSIPNAFTLFTPPTLK
ncbi:hypothetical protein HDU76_008378 [Blyttiomyces sp. JEL0837]|nr:hypothetical protein HDU76_008378 [Blyttiomyces sp. JEL0837]